ncbi:MAG: hypothetical protein WCI05_15395 [Myxococcales bacterium]
MISTRTEEAILPFRTTKAQVTMVTRFKSTWVTSSQLALRERGVFDRYKELLPVELHTALVFAVAGEWLPTPLVVSHYECCDQLGLSDAEVFTVGAAVTRRVHDSALRWVAGLATATGAVTPWTILSRLDRLWDRVIENGGIAVFQVGPQDARIELAAFPLAHVMYIRLALRGVLTAVTELFCKRATVREVRELRRPHQLTFLASWV